MIYLGHLPRQGIQLFEAVSPPAWRGSSRSRRAPPTRSSTGRPPWVKIKNPIYSQAEGRHDFFNAGRPFGSARHA